MKVVLIGIISCNSVMRLRYNGLTVIVCIALTKNSMSSQVAVIYLIATMFTVRM